MRAFSVTILKKNFYSLIDELEVGKPFVVTKNGKPIAKFGVVDGEIKREYAKERDAKADPSV